MIYRAEQYLPDKFKVPFAEFYLCKLDLATRQLYIFGGNSYIFDQTTKFIFIHIN